MTKQQKDKIHKKAAKLFPDYKVKGTYDSQRFPHFVAGALFSFEIGRRAGIKEALKNYQLSNQ
jgi:hypothetical protein